ncbi:MAG: RNA polymerase factor sigma-54 [Sphingomonadaceae bacterium]|nr:RNA polymerase factor sigma-54 [Sphingomonadaceae bacterium]
MALGPRLDLRQSQQLVMTPQLQQAIKLLALSNLEIEGFIAEELEKNPLLEAERDEEREPGGLADEDGFADSAQPETADNLVSSGATGEEAQLDIDPEALTDDGASDRAGLEGSLDGALGMAGAGGGGGEDGPDIDALGSSGVSLHDHLLSQAGSALSGKQHMIAAQLIERIDETGYLRADLLRLSQQLGVATGEIEEVLECIQSFDPTGVGARDLSECLAIQAREADRYDPAMARLLDNLDLLARGELGRLKRMCRVDDEDMADMIAELRDYDPKPGCRYGGETIQAVVPDIFVASHKNGWAVELNNATLPRLIVNRAYHAELDAAGGSDEASKAWLNECLSGASWLVRALDQRAKTITKVASELVKRQEGFFRHGVSQLKPLTLREIAKAIEMHESTVSRATSNKYLSCDRGVFELKYFFSSGVGTDDGGDASAEAVKSHIRSLIDKEEKILSDDKLVALLKEQGFDIARRTVAKYREAMGIGSSVERRRQRKLQNRAA